MTERRFKPFIALAEDAGLVVDGVATGKHLKLRLIAPDGRSRMFVVPKTGSDHRGMLNTAADFRRFARGG